MLFGMHAGEESCDLYQRYVSPTITVAPSTGLFLPLPRCCANGVRIGPRQIGFCLYKYDGGTSGVVAVLLICLDARTRTPSLPSALF